MRIFTSAPIRKGDETVVFSEKKHKIGARVNIFSVLGGHFGTKPIASGRVISACKDERAAPVTPTKTGQPNANPLALVISSQSHEGQIKESDNGRK